jgi:hypothetical protein
VTLARGFKLFLNFLNIEVIFQYSAPMIQFFLFIFSIVFALNSYGQIEFNSKLKAIKPQAIPVKPKKEKDISSPVNVFKLNIPKIVAPNVFKETNIFGTKPKVDNSFAIGTPANNFSMIQKNKFDHKLGDVYQDKMTKDLSKTLVNEGLKEDDRYLVKIDVNYGDIRTKSEYFVIKFRDFGVIDGDLVKAVFNDKTIVNSVQLEYSFQEFRIYFKEGFNVLKLEALNRGFLGGNTGEFQIYDAEGKFITSDFWQNWDIGVKGLFTIIKE